MISRNFDWNKTKQLSAVQLILAFAIPSAIAYVGFRVVLPMLVENGTPAIIAWPSIASAMLLVLVIMAFVFLRSEARQLNISLASRMCLKRLSVKQWTTYLVIIAIGLIIAVAATQLVVPFMNVTGITIPSYMPFFLNPAINPAEVDPAVLSPGFPLKGQFILIPLMAITILLNILAEELYFRAWLLPKMSKYGKISWVINGTLFALYHSYQFWLLPTILVASLLMAFVIYKSKSIWPALVAHFVGNFLFTILGILMLVLG
jgi:membrane protease YdiL (CAAX protease family)